MMPDDLGCWDDEVKRRLEINTVFRKFKQMGYNCGPSLPMAMPSVNHNGCEMCDKFDQLYVANVEDVPLCLCEQCAKDIGFQVVHFPTGETIATDIAPTGSNGKATRMPPIWPPNRIIK